MNSDNKLSSLLSLTTINLNLKGRSKQAIIDEMVQMLDEAKLLRNRVEVRKAVMEREAKLSTGLGFGIAVPHGKTNGVDKLVGALGVQREGVPFDSADGEPAKIFFMLISPENVTGPHIKALAALAKFLRTDKKRKALLAANSPEKVLTIFDENA